MRKIALAGVIGLLMLVAVPQARAEFALGDQDRVVFFGDKVLATPEMAMGVETFVRIRYPNLKTRFRNYGRHTAATLKGVVERFEKEVVPIQPTVVVLCFATDAVPRREFDERHLDRFKGDFVKLVNRAKQTGARLYIMTPLCPDVARNAKLKSIKYDETMGKYAETLREIAREHGGQVIDWFTASKQYLAKHGDNKRLAITSNGAFPTILGCAIGMTSILEAWSAEPCKITVTADWNSDSVTASSGQVVVTKVGEDKIQLKLTGVTIPWVVPNRGTIPEEHWPGTKYYSFVLRVSNIPEGGIMISEPNGKNALPYLSQQLRQGTDLGFVGPLTKLDAVAGLAKWITAKCEAVRRHREFMLKPVPEPEYQKSYETYYLGLEQYADATDQIVLRQPRVVDVTLELYKAPLSPKKPDGKKIKKRGRAKPVKKHGGKRIKEKKPRTNP